VSPLLLAWESPESLPDALLPPHALMETAISPASSIAAERLKRLLLFIFLSSC